MFSFNNTDERDPFGRIATLSVPEPEISGIRNPASLSAPVGTTGQNQRRDVAKVETLLGSAGELDLKKTDGPTGYWGFRTEDATKTFQKKHGLKVDGLVNPGGETVTKLAEIASNQAEEGQETPPASPGPQPNCPKGTYDAGGVCLPLPSGGGIRG